MVELEYDSTGNHKLWHCFWLSLGFFAVYFLIHVLLNMADPEKSGCQGPCAEVVVMASAAVGTPAEMSSTSGHGGAATSPKDAVTAPANSTETALAAAAKSHSTAGSPDQVGILDDEYWKNLAGPFSISLCSSLLIFSFAVFLLQGMEHLSVAAPFSFLKAFFIFIFGLIIIQIAGHAEIFKYSAPFEEQDHAIQMIITFLSTATLPISFFSLYLLERYQANVYDAVSAQLPDAVFSHHPHPNALAGFTLASIFLSFGKVTFHNYIFTIVTEFVISACAVLIVFKPELIPAARRARRSQARARRAKDGSVIGGGARHAD